MAVAQPCLEAAPGGGDRLPTPLAPGGVEPCGGLSPLPGGDRGQRQVAARPAITPVLEGMVVRTDSPTLRATARNGDRNCCSPRGTNVLRGVRGHGLASFRTAPWKVGMDHSPACPTASLIARGSLHQRFGPRPTNRCIPLHPLRAGPGNEGWRAPTLGRGPWRGEALAGINRRGLDQAPGEAVDACTDAAVREWSALRRPPSAKGDTVEQKHRIPASWSHLCGPRVRRAGVARQ